MMTNAQVALLAATQVQQKDTIFGTPRKPTQFEVKRDAESFLNWLDNQQKDKEND